MIKSFITLTHGGKREYHGYLLQNFNPRKSRVQITAVNYYDIFMKLARGGLITWCLAAASSLTI
jgi:hypothetical protein